MKQIHNLVTGIPSRTLRKSVLLEEQPIYPSDVFDRLMNEIHARVRELPPDSYTTKLVEGGVAKMGGKIMEEAAEVVDAAEKQPAGDDQHLVYEACDLIYHLWVLLGSRGISVEQLRRELERREGTSGLEEKRRRSQQ